jgi:hypothetical protein
VPAASDDAWETVRWESAVMSGPFRGVVSLDQPVTPNVVYAVLDDVE